MIEHIYLEISSAIRSRNVAMFTPSDLFICHRRLYGSRLPFRRIARKGEIFDKCAGLKSCGLHVSDHAGGRLE
ncbi:hypothetical protein, partial [Massilia pseudoviolaceinigra]|uniref:hypothetical protein n=1 Tax=Massilia pseudoviolaceinigra TaxID=3057165 RepID=UPI00279687C5